MIGIPFCGSAHRDPKNPAGDYIPAPVWEPKAASGGSRLAKEPHFDQTVFDSGLLCQLDLADLKFSGRCLDLGEGEGFYINWL